MSAPASNNTLNSGTTNESEPDDLRCRSSPAARAGICRRHPHQCWHRQRFTIQKAAFLRRTGDRVLVLLTAGNLAACQSVISIINEQLSPEAPTDRPSLMNVSSMYRAARLVGDAVREVRAIDGPSLDASKTGFSVSCILGGQVGDEAPRLFQIYDEGNFIEATDDTPYLQIGEHKYGKPILDRVVHPEMRL